jgi:predicted DNA-binding transcriptional regulator YafY
MSFSKAQDLIRLARMAATRRMGIGLDEICEEFGVSHRTAQRMTDALETVFINVDTVDGPDRRRRWRVTDPMLDRLQPRQETAIEALEIAGRTARSDGLRIPR